MTNHSANRNHTHLYANYSLIKNLSQLLFNSGYESDMNTWKQLSVEEINSTAASLYRTSEDTLQKDNSLTEII